MADESGNSLGVTYVEISAKIDKLQEGLDSLKHTTEQKAEEIGSTFSNKITEHVKKAAEVIAGLFAAEKIFDFLKEGVQLFGKSEDALNKLNFAVGNGSKELSEYAEGLDKITRYKKTELMNGMAFMGMYTQDTDQIKKLTQASMDLAAARGMSFEAAGNMVTRSFGSQANALRRMGIEVQGASSSEERLRMITEGIANHFGGAAASAAHTYAGRMEIIGHNVESLQIALGAELVPAIESVAGGMDEAAQGTQKATVMMQALGGAARIIAGVFLVVKTIIMTTAQVLGTLGAELVAFSQFDFKGMGRIFDKSNQDMVSSFDDYFTGMQKLMSKADSLDLNPTKKLTLGGDSLKDQKEAQKQAEADAKAKLDAQYALMESLGKLYREDIKNCYDRDEKEALDSYTFEMLKLENEKKAQGLSQDAKDAITAREQTQKAILDLAIKKNNEARATDEAKLAQETLDKKIAFDKSYNDKMMSLKKDQFDSQIKDYSLSLADYKSYLAQMLALKLKALEDENAKITEFNKKNNVNNPLIDIGQQKQFGEKENNAQSKDYQKSQNDKIYADWKKHNTLMYDSAKTLTSSLVSNWKGAVSQMLNGTMSLGDGIKTIFTGIGESIENAILDALGKVLEGLVENLLMQKAVTTAAATANATIGVTTAGVLSAAYSTPAMLASIMSFGGADVSGMAGFTAAMTVAKGSNMIPSFANGGDFVVPNGFPNDSYLMRAQSGEHVSITPANSSKKSAANEKGSDNHVASLINGLNMNLVNLLSKNVNTAKVVALNVDGKTLAKVLIKNENKLTKTGYNFNEYNS